MNQSYEGDLRLRPDDWQIQQNYTAQLLKQKQFGRALPLLVGLSDGFPL